MRNATDWIEGHLDFIRETDRYGLVVNGMWARYGFHNGEALEVMVDGEWVKTRMLRTKEVWYLEGTPYSGDLFKVDARVPVYH